jgi:predicted CopG family antitoxin
MTDKTTITISDGLRHELKVLAAKGRYTFEELLWKMIEKYGKRDR